ncbi:MAG: arginine repressor [Myxococcales bacterium]|nr:arginine repressor [Myxococcales bacterium]MCA9568320.1 arginine repressor [Myxococcales bacterium]
MTWRTVLNDLVETGSYRTQRELVRAIERRTGRRINQASVSRELTVLGVRKVEGVYRLGPELEIMSHVKDVKVTAGGCLVVLRCDIAFASVIAQAVDMSEIEGVLGTIAGDDTVFVATSGMSATEPLLELLGHG